MADPTPSTIDAGWTPYTPDPALTTQQNLEAKDAYDKKVPAGHDPNLALAPKAPPALEPPKPAPAPVAVTVEDLVMPEGMTIDPETSTVLLDVLNKNAGDPKALINNLLALQAKAYNDQVTLTAKAWDDLQADWKAKSAADPVFGGPKYAASQAVVTSIIAQYGTPAMQEALETTGMGNHPEFMRFVTSIAPFLKEAAPVPPSIPAPTKGGYTPTDLYPNNPK